MQKKSFLKTKKELDKEPVDSEQSDTEFSSLKRCLYLENMVKISLSHLIRQHSRDSWVRGQLSTAAACLLRHIKLDFIQFPLMSNTPHDWSWRCSNFHFLWQKMWSCPFWIKITFILKSKLKQKHVFVSACLTYAVLQQGIYGSRLVNNSELDSRHYCAASQRRTCE